MSMLRSPSAKALLLMNVLVVGLLVASRYVVDLALMTDKDSFAMVLVLLSLMLFVSLVFLDALALYLWVVSRWEGRS